MSEELKARFKQASDDVTKLPKAPDNDVKLKLYALYKQGAQGDCVGPRPGIMDFVGRVKYDSWKNLEGTSQDDAMQQYADLVESLKAAK